MSVELQRLLTDDYDFHSGRQHPKPVHSSNPEHRSRPRVPMPLHARYQKESEEMAGWLLTISHLQQAGHGLRWAPELYR
jgi:hypothetical protein